MFGASGKQDISLPLKTQIRGERYTGHFSTELGGQEEGHLSQQVGQADLHGCRRG